MSAGERAEKSGKARTAPTNNLERISPCSSWLALPWENPCDSGHTDLREAQRRHPERGRRVLVLCYRIHHDGMSPDTSEGRKRMKRLAEKGEQNEPSAFIY